MENHHKATDGVMTGKRVKTSPELIAPCGMNCALCRAFGRNKNACQGCRGGDSFKSKSCALCRIKNCEKLATTEADFCFGCESFPCAGLTRLDRRYRTKYGMSMIDNLSDIRNFGIGLFIGSEETKWTCPECGALLCVHKPQCLHCQHEWR